MSYHELEPNPTLPEPNEIARRVALATQDRGISPDTELGPGTCQEVYFGLADDRSAGSAVVNLSRFSQYTQLRNGQEVPVWRGSRYAHIGHYDPVQQNWLLYPEYVKPDERQALTAEIEQQAEISHSMLVAEAQSGKPFIDLRHPLTIQARKETAEILTNSKVGSRLIADNSMGSLGNHARSDDFTTCAIAITTKLRAPEIGSELYLDELQRADPWHYSVSFSQRLIVAYRGLILDADGGTIREDKYIPIASKSTDDKNEWIPNQKLITPAEWDILSHAPKALLEYRCLHPDFSAEHCAVVPHYSL